MHGRSLATIDPSYPYNAGTEHHGQGRGMIVNPHIVLFRLPCCLALSDALLDYLLRNEDVLEVKGEDSS